jgi:hypothetical protein
MLLILYLFFGFVGLVILYFMLQNAISGGIDNSKEMKALRSELEEIKKQLKASEHKG